MRTVVAAAGIAAALVVSTSAHRLSDWSEAENLGPAINSAFNDQHPAISNDNLTLYFVSDRPGGAGGTDIWVARRRRVGAAWSTPVPLPATINTNTAEFAPTLAADGHALVFGSERSGGCGGRDIWVSLRRNTRDDFGWGPAVNLGCDVNFSGFDDGPTWFEDRRGRVTLYFTSQNRPGGFGDFDIWASEMNRDGSFGPAYNVAELNSPARDTRTAIRRDGLEMLFTSTRPGSLLDVNGNVTLDLWVSTRPNTHAPWSEPEPAGAMNGAFNDGAPALSEDAEDVYFYSNRPGGFGANDLWVSHRDMKHGRRDSPGRGHDRRDNGPGHGRR